ncbi:hypothetical protein B0J13DRAFT_288464 [Dactylonectria estremocensis]|uniref:CFEM domain-containing protein n=1 Tax=Dactylonectria estremocensis TaxID=1079267 RepID=A0A9P9F219_9HYPO|nr:hypothetical protein B0J13DRAFT_288464 [Dactylonectria estremocensis]
MANANAAELIASIPECVSGCFQNGVAATGCDVDDYDCYCYANNHQTIVDTMSICLDNRERKLDVECTDDDMFQMENRYWTVCKEYWEPTGTAVEPASATITSTKTTSTSTKTTATRTTSTFSSSQLTSVASASSLESSSIVEEAAKSTETASNEQTKDDTSGLSVGAQAGIGIGAGLAVILLAVSIFLWIRERNRRRRLEEKLLEANETALVRGMAYVNEKGDIYEMEGDRPYVEELRGDMRTPELSAIPHPKPVKQKPGSIRSVSTATSVSSSDLPSPRLLSPTTALRPPGRGARVMSADIGPSGRPERVSNEDESTSVERRGST